MDKSLAEDMVPREPVSTLLARIDERTKSIAENLERLEKQTADQFKLYVTKTEFWPVKTIVYSAVAIILMAVLGAVVTLVVVRH